MELSDYKPLLVAEDVATKAHAFLAFGIELRHVA